MSTITAVARAFVEGRSARCHNATTDGFTYWLHGHPIAVKGDGVVRFNFCGWRTPTTRNHMSHIHQVGKLPGWVSTAQRGGSPDTFEVQAPWAKQQSASNSGHQAPRTRYHKTDGWRGYEIPAFAVAGSSDCGMCSDSPAPSDKVEAELQRFQRECLLPHGIKSKLAATQSSNVFMVKRWVVVGARDFERAAQLAINWLNENERDTRYIHGADLEELGYKVEEVAAT